MANTNAPYGLRAVKHMSGGDIRTNPHKVASGNSIIYRGDLVKATTDGGIDVAAAGERAIGAAAKYVGASTTDNADFPVYDDKNIVFEIQANGNTVEADKFQLANIVATTGDTNTRQSKHVLGTSTQGTSEAQLRILGKVDAPDNDWGDYVRLLVQIHMHEFGEIEAGTPGV